ncbi:MAG: hypothetical protein IKU48_05330 [Clostridia bacterium]|nr:hypothetical protein [Clostridia bacterium]
MIITEVVEFKKFGKCLRLDNGKAEMYVTLDVGPRIIKFNASGCENMLYNDDKLEKEVDVSSMFGEGKKWYTYGGHRMWISPEEMPKTYYPDEDAVEYSVEKADNEVKVVLTPPPQKVTDMQEKYIITMGEGDSVRVEHYLKNVGKETVRKGIWGITVTDINGIAVMKQPESNNALLPNRHVVFWPYTRMNDERFLLGEKYIAVQQDPADTQVPAKIGYTNYEGRLYCFNKGQAMSVSYDSDYSKGEYPDFNVSSEIYTNKDILEIESLGHIGDILPGNTVVHTEVWSVVPCDVKPTLNEDEIDKAMKKVFG